MAWSLSAAFLLLALFGFFYSSLKGNIWARATQCWAQALGLSLLVATCLHTYLPIGKSMGVLWATSALFYFFIETAWCAFWIKAVTKNNSFFPHYESLKNLPIPRESRLIRLTEKVEESHFIPTEAYSCQLGGLLLKGVFYLDGHQQILLELVFAPIGFRGKLEVFFSFTTPLEDGSFSTTDNYHGPPALHESELYHLMRSPSTRDFNCLLKRHVKTLKQLTASPIAFPPTPSWVNYHNARAEQLKQMGLEKGFFRLSQQAPYELTISAEGRFQIWKSSIKMRYFGLA